MLTIRIKKNQTSIYFNYKNKNVEKNIEKKTLMIRKKYISLQNKKC